jgi:hypothetical protein
MKRSWPYFELLLRHFPRGTEDNHENLSQDSRSPGRDLKARRFQVQSSSAEHCQGATFDSEFNRPIDSQTQYHRVPQCNLFSRTETS